MIKTYVMIFSLLTKQERRRFFVLIVLSLIMSMFEAASVVSILPFLQVLSDPTVIDTHSTFNWIYTTISFESARTFTVFLGGIVFFVTVMSLVLKAIMVYALTRFGMMRAYRLSASMLTGYLHQPYIWFLSRHSSDLGNGVLSEVDRTVSSSILPALRLIPDLFTALLITGVLFYLEPTVAIGAVVLLGGAYVVIYFSIRQLLFRIGTERKDANKARFHAVQEAMGGIKEMKLMGLEEIFLQRYRVAAIRMAKTQTRGQVLSQIPRYALESLAMGGMILMILYFLVRGDGNLTTILPSIGLVAMAGIRLFPALQQVYGKIATIRFGQAALERVHDDITGLQYPDQKTRRARTARAAIALRKQLEIKDVSYRYPNTDQAALNNLALTMEANTTIGLVGGTGAGKTTLVDIVLGLLEPESGAVLVDGTAITSDTMRAWQKALGYVPQHIFLSDDTVRGNIAFGIAEDEIDDDAVIRAAKAACLHDFVTTEMPQGYDTKVGERGARLSGGQRQRVGIARALYHDPDVLIMDEATSALDNLTERAVMDAVHNISGTKTILMIAHRLTTVQNCDKVFVLRQGQVAASGTFDELIKTDSEFAEMAREK